MSNISKRTYDLNDKELDSQIASLKEYVDALISSIPKFNIEVVSELPTGKNVSFTTVYLLRGDGGTGNLYEEYICVQPPGLQGGIWEKIGSADIDIAGYAKVSDLTSGELTVKNANVANEATYASYASTDRSKGTIEARLTVAENNKAVTGAPTLNAAKKLTERGYYYIELCQGTTSIGQGIIYYSGATGVNTKIYIKSFVEKYEGFVQVRSTGEIKIYYANSDGTYSESTSGTFRIYTAKLNI